MIAERTETRRTHQTRLRTERPPGWETVARAMLGPIIKEWRWSETAVSAWIDGGEKRGVLASQSRSGTAAVRGSYTRQGDQERFVLALTKAGNHSTEWTMRYEGRRTDEALLLHASLDLSNRRGDQRAHKPADDLLLPLRSLIDALPFADGSLRVTGRVIPGAEPHEIDALAAGIADWNRRLPVLVLTEPWNLDIRDLARRLAGLGHVAAVRQEMTFRLTDALGKEHGVYNGYGRLYAAPLLLENGRTGNRHVRFDPASLAGPEAADMLANRMETETLGVDLGLDTDQAAKTPSIANNHKEASNNGQGTNIMTVAADEATKEQEPIAKTTGAGAHALRGKPLGKPNPAAERSDHLGERIRYARLRMGMTQVDLARRVSLTGPAIGFIEKKADAQGDTIDKIIALLQIERPDSKPKLDGTAKKGAKQGRKSTIAAADAAYNALALRVSELEAELGRANERLGALEKRPGTTAETSARPILGDDSIEDMKTAMDMLQEAFARLIGPAKDGKSEKAIPDEKKNNIAATESADQDEGGYPRDLRPQTVERYLERFEGRVQLHPRAERGLKESVYQNPQRMYRALEILGAQYVPMRRNEKGGEGRENGAFASMTKELGELGLRLEKMKDSHAINNGHPLRIVWRQRNRILDYALKSNSSPKDPTRCLRIYFFWDEEAETAVVGWLPSHLNVPQWQDS